LPQGSRINTETGDVTIVAAATITPTGSGIEIAIGNATTKANATAIVTTNRQNLSTGTVTIKAKATVLPTGSELEVAVPTSINIKQWDGVVPGVSQTWTRIQTP